VRLEGGFLARSSFLTFRNGRPIIAVETPTNTGLPVFVGVLTPLSANSGVFLPHQQAWLIERMFG
jgi:hypothetical protein